MPLAIDNLVDNHYASSVRRLEEPANTIDVYDLDGSGGFVIRRATGGSSYSYSTASLGIADFIGDVNNDGIDDILISDPGKKYPAETRGVVYLIFGRQGDKPFGAPKYTLGSEGVRFFDSTRAPDGDEENIGWSLKGLGDFNGDGVPDFAIGGAHSHSEGAKAHESAAIILRRCSATIRWQCYVVFGDRTWQARAPAIDIDLASMDGTNGFRIRYNNPESDARYCQPSQGGDINGDGYNDVVLSGYNMNVVVLYGGPMSYLPASFNGILDLYSTDSQVPHFDVICSAFDLEGAEKYDARHMIRHPDSRRAHVSLFGWPIGDLNSDGKSEILIREPYVKKQHWRLSYEDFSKYINESDVKCADLNNVTSAQGGSSALSPQFRQDIRVGAISDVTGDGVTDFSYLRDIHWSDAETFGTEIRPGGNMSDWIGIIDAGDFNGDTIPDLLVSDSRYDSTRGRVYVIHGCCGIWGRANMTFGCCGNIFGESFDPEAMDIYRGVKIENTQRPSGSYLGNPIGRGDFNGDGVSDIIISTNSMKNAFVSGDDDAAMGAYVVFGSSDWAPQWCKQQQDTYDALSYIAVSQRPTILF
ncbi:unnamed protein product [Vitrella brassicaformis CCMP3155]|uniref:Uncharacterized protein n=1 Tax=Vitrella brassicaformis (strain CCMP3155) TaxID=1169540 RepID=A0A0G4EPB3_VITBC|nr:unnamed protein product [Vitrella brassicaformis CCMP3155]|eukprot:CEL99291.1 unnamed protein product [Vitrella brassicaformis CCMP3155]